MIRFIACLVGALISAVAGVLFCIVEIPNDSVAFFAALVLLVAVALAWGWLAGKAPRNAIVPAKLERGATYVLQLHEPTTCDERDELRRQVCRMQDLAGCKFVVLDHQLELVSGKIGGPYD